MDAAGAEALKEVGGLIATHGGPKGKLFATILSAIAAMALLFSLTVPKSILGGMGAKEVTFTGTVFESSGVRLPGVRVWIDGFQAKSEVTDSEGMYALCIKTDGLADSYVTVVFELGASGRHTRRACWKGENKVYADIVLNKGGTTNVP